MVKTLDWILNSFEKYRKAFALSFFFFGLPIVYFLRDGIKLAPGNKVFTAALTLGALFAAIPLKNFKRIYVPNIKIVTFTMIYWFFGVLYLAIYTPHLGWFTNPVVEAVNIFMILSAVYIFSTVSINDIKDTFLPFTVIISVVGCLGLLFIILRNPAYVIGMRAGIAFDSGTEGTEVWSNPHIYGRAAFAGIVGIIIMLRQKLSFLYKLMLYGGGLVCFIVLVLTQSFQTFIAFGIFGMLYTYFNVNAGTFYRIYKWIFSWKGLLLFSVIAYGIFYLWNYTRFNEIAINLSDKIFERFDKVGNLFSGSKTSATAAKYVTADESASQRITNITQVFTNISDNWESGYWFKIIIGNGYHHFYVDAPIFQTFNDLGIFAFLSYLLIHIVIIKWSLKEFKEKNNLVILFLSYFFVHTFVQNFVFGMPYDYQRWTYFLFLGRFYTSQYFEFNTDYKLSNLQGS